MINKDQKSGLPINVLTNALPINIPAVYRQLFDELITKKLLELSGNLASSGNLNQAVTNLKGSTKLDKISFDLNTLLIKYKKTVASYPVRVLIKEVKDSLVNAGFSFKATPPTPLKVLKNEVARLIRIYQLISNQISDGVKGSLNPLIENLKLLIDFKDKK